MCTPGPGCRRSSRHSARPGTCPSPRGPRSPPGRRRSIRHRPATSSPASGRDGQRSRTGPAARPAPWPRWRGPSWPWRSRPGPGWAAPAGRRSPAATPRQQWPICPRAPCPDRPGHATHSRRTGTSDPRRRSGTPRFPVAEPCGGSRRTQGRCERRSRPRSRPALLAAIRKHRVRQPHGPSRLSTGRWGRGPCRRAERRRRSLPSASSHQPGGGVLVEVALVLPEVVGDPGAQTRLGVEVVRPAPG